MKALASSVHARPKVIIHRIGPAVPVRRLKRGRAAVCLTLLAALAASAWAWLAPMAQPVLAELDQITDMVAR